MKKIIILLAALICHSAFCGTLIYKGNNNEKKIISEIEIISIDRNIVTFKIGKGTRNIHFSKISKYYDSDINMNLAFDDNSSDYDLKITNLKLPVNKKGITKKVKKEAQNNKITFEYSISPKPSKGQNKNVKIPHFYVFLLTTGGKGTGSNIYSFYYPESAKIKNSKVYNEALMLEAALSSERQRINPRYLFGAGVDKSLNKISIDISKIGNRKIIAYHIVAWGKDDIVDIKNDILDHSYEVSKNWHLLHRSKK